MRFGKDKVKEPAPVDTAPKAKPRLEITTATTARIIGQNFEITPRDELGSVWIRRTTTGRFEGYHFTSMTVPARMIPELLALLAEAERVNLDPPSKVTRNLEGA